MKIEEMKNIEIQGVATRFFDKKSYLHINLLFSYKRLYFYKNNNKIAIYQHFF